MRLRLVAAAMAFALLGVVAGATHSPSPDPSGSAPTTSPSSTVSATSPASPSASLRSASSTRTLSAAEKDVLGHVQFCFTDNFLYGFCEPVSERPRRIADRFTVYVFPLDGANVTYKVLLDERPAKLSGGKTSRTTDEATRDALQASAARRVHLEVEVTLAGKAPVLVDYGELRVRPLSSLFDDEDDLKDRIERTIRTFTESEWTWFHVRSGLVGILAIGLAAFAAVQRRREKQEGERPALVAY